MKRFFAILLTVMVTMSSLSILSSAVKLTGHWDSANVAEGGDGTYTLPEGSVLIPHNDNLSTLAAARAPGAAYEVSVTGTTVEVYNIVENSTVTNKLDIYIDGTLVQQVDGRVPFSVVKSGLADTAHTVKVAVNDATSTEHDNKYMFYLTGVRATSVEVNPILYNPNVTFYSIGDGGVETKIELPAIDQVTDGGVVGAGSEIQTHCSKNPASHHLPEFPLVEGSTDVWAQAAGTMGNCVIEIKFVGTQIKLGTCYRNDGGGSSKLAKVEIDGVEYAVNNDKLMPPVPEGATPGNVHDTTPTYFFEATGLKDIEHTVRIYNLDTSARLAIDHYEIVPGTGADTQPTPTESTPAGTVPSPDNGDLVMAVALVAVLSGATLVLSKKKR